MKARHPEGASRVNIESIQGGSEHLGKEVSLLQLILPRSVARAGACGGGSERAV